jgi:hypothetical protein
VLVLRFRAWGDSEKGVGDADAVVVLAVVEVFGNQFGGAGGTRGGEDEGVPEGDFPAGLLIQPGLEEVEGVLVALMGLVAVQRLATETKAFLQAREGSLAVGSLGARPDDPIEAEQHELFERGFSLSSHDFRAVQERLGQINGCLHWQ